eukprot:scaffold1911_cov397-Prasinococcus_capsulatus_cf.AAC.21
MSEEALGALGLAASRPRRSAGRDRCRRAGIDSGVLGAGALSPGAVEVDTAPGSSYATGLACLRALGPAERSARRVLPQAQRHWEEHARDRLSGSNSTRREAAALPTR